MFKKLTILVCCIVVPFAFGQLKVSADVTGTLSGEVMGISMDSDAALGIDLSYDHLLGSTDLISYGAGAEYQLNRGFKDTDEDGEGKFGFTSVFGFGKYDVNENIYGKAKLGYALMFSGDDDFKGDGDLKGGLMFGAGMGYVINEQIAAELFYYSNKGEISEGDFSIDVEYTRINVGVCYSF